MNIVRECFKDVEARRKDIVQADLALTSAKKSEREALVELKRVLLIYLPNLVLRDIENVLSEVYWEDRSFGQVAKDVYYDLFRSSKFVPQARKLPAHCRCGSVFDVTANNWTAVPPQCVSIHQIVGNDAALQLNQTCGGCLAEKDKVRKSTKVQTDTSSTNKNEPIAIQTSYRGYRFRSRLEARWAVFFDYLKSSWEYEKEGVLLPCGPYLPDFWFPDPDGVGPIWVETKPNIVIGRDMIAERVGVLQQKQLEENLKCSELSVATSDRVVMLSGMPDECEVRVWSAGVLIGQGVLGENAVGIDFGVRNFSCGLRVPTEVSRPFMKMACSAAKSARFEHGESPECKS